VLTTTIIIGLLALVVLAVLIGLALGAVGVGAGPSGSDDPPR
jgi:hypothetical protein